MDKFIRYSVDDVKEHIVEKENWGSYFIIDDFMQKSVFEEPAEKLLS